MTFGTFRSKKRIVQIQLIGPLSSFTKKLAKKVRFALDCGWSPPISEVLYSPHEPVPPFGPDLEGLWGQRLPHHLIIN